MQCNMLTIYYYADVCSCTCCVANKVTLSIYIIYICHSIIVMHCINPVARQKVLHPADTTIVVSPMYSAMFVIV